MGGVEGVGAVVHRLVVGIGRVGRRCGRALGGRMVAGCAALCNNFALVWSRCFDVNRDASICGITKPRCCSD